MKLIHWEAPPESPSALDHIWVSARHDRDHKGSAHKDGKRIEGGIEAAKPLSPEFFRNNRWIVQPEPE
jgi:hypothetical protein